MQLTDLLVKVSERGISDDGFLQRARIKLEEALFSGQLDEYDARKKILAVELTPEQVQTAFLQYVNNFLGAAYTPESPQRYDQVWERNRDVKWFDIASEIKEKYGFIPDNMTAQAGYAKLIIFREFQMLNRWQEITSQQLSFETAEPFYNGFANNGDYQSMALLKAFGSVEIPLSAKEELFKRLFQDEKYEDIKRAREILGELTGRMEHIVHSHYDKHAGNWEKGRDVFRKTFESTGVMPSKQAVYALQLAASCLVVFNQVKKAGADYEDSDKIVDWVMS